MNFSGFHKFGRDYLASIVFCDSQCNQIAHCQTSVMNTANLHSNMSCILSSVCNHYLV